MGFHDRAWNAAADQYGRDRSEKYGKVARAVALFKLLLGVALVIGIITMWNIGH